MLIREMNSGDVPAAMQFCRSAGWNQLHADWSRLIDHESRGCFVAEENRQILGTVTTTRYANKLAWIGMMLIHPDFRRRGIATTLVKASLTYLQKAGVDCVKLDATPEGQRVYERLGFVPEWAFHRWCRKQEVTASNQPSMLTQALNRSHLELDRDAFGADRSDWLQRLASDSKVCVREDGFAMLRPGHLADYLGPVVAKTSAVAAELVITLLNESTRELIFWDVLNPDAEAIAISQGFQRVRELTRMWTGTKRDSPKMQLQYAPSGPATG